MQIKSVLKKQRLKKPQRGLFGEDYFAAVCDVGGKFIVFNVGKPEIFKINRQIARRI